MTIRITMITLLFLTIMKKNNGENNNKNDNINDNYTNYNNNYNNNNKNNQNLILKNIMNYGNELKKILTIKKIYRFSSSK